MSLRSTIYCLDANVLIKAWESYYAPKFCPSYWTVLDELERFYSPWFSRAAA